jgi:SAM-dependent methyltransferase
MAVDRRALESLLYATRRHRLGATVMLGRHGLSLRARTLRRIFAAFGRSLTDEAAESLRATGFAEPLLMHLGATSVDSIDASDYEGANLIADLSRPVPAEWRNRYDTVCDFGTIEHIFHFPQAFANCLSLLKPDGLYLCLTCGNNYCGHGFYQFSPELWFSLLSANRCTDIEVFLIPTRPDPLWFKSPIRAP